MSIDSHEAATGELHRVQAGFGDRFFLDAMPEEDVAEFGKDYPLGRTAQPAELAPPYVMLASDEASYISSYNRRHRRKTDDVIIRLSDIRNGGKN